MRVTVRSVHMADRARTQGRPAVYPTTIFVANITNGPHHPAYMAGRSWEGIGFCRYTRMFQGQTRFCDVRMDVLRFFNPFWVVRQAHTAKHRSDSTTFRCPFPSRECLCYSVVLMTLCHNGRRNRSPYADCVGTGKIYVGDQYLLPAITLLSLAFSGVLIPPRKTVRTSRGRTVVCTFSCDIRVLPTLRRRYAAGPQPAGGVSMTCRSGISYQLTPRTLSPSFFSCACDAGTSILSTKRILNPIGPFFP